MTRKSHFTSQRTALFLGIGFISASLFAWITYAQLNIPTGLSNAMITIQKIMLSTNGTSIDENNSASTIFLDGINGNITTKWPGNFPWWNLNIGGNVVASWEVRLKHADFNGTGCDTLTWCILKVTTDGKVQVTNNVNPWLGNEDQELWKEAWVASTPNDAKDIYFWSASNPTENGSGSQIKVRIWVSNNTYSWTTSQAQLIVRKQIESREWLKVLTSPTAAGNIWTISSNSIWVVESLIENDTNTRAMIIKNTTRIDPFNNMVSNVIFKSDNSNTLTKVGINFNPGSSNTIQRVPSAELHVAQGWVFMVWWRPGAPSFCDQSGTCTADVGTNTFMVDSNTQKVGIWLSNSTGPQKTLDVKGDVAVSNTLTVGHASTFDPGSDKLAVNGSTRANAYYYNSDSRYKSDIEALQSPLKKLLEITWYTYFNKLSNKKDIWVIAQEVESVYPELVQTNADGYKSVQYGNLVAPIIEAIKEIASKIDSLFTLYVSQQARIDTLEARLQVLEAKVK